MSFLPLENTLPVAAGMSQELNRVRSMIESAQFLDALGALGTLAAQDIRHAQSSQVWLHIGFVYTRMGLWPRAIEALQMALQLEPRMPDAQRLLALAYFSVGQKHKACELIDQACKNRKDIPAHWLMRAYLHAHSFTDPLRTLHSAQDWGRRVADPMTRQAPLLQVRDRNPRKRLKVGYVTADFRTHSVAFFMRPVLEQHDPDCVEVYVYSNANISLSDAMTAQMRALVPHWNEVADLSDEQMYTRIRDDGIDVLVDLSGFTAGHRLEVFARRPAPVQLTWIGYMNTLGMKAMDYRLVDAYTAPPEHAAYYSEALFQLECSACYIPPAHAPLCEELPMLRSGYPTLVSLNSSAKITDDMLTIWSRILQARTDARLIIMVKEQDADSAQAHMQPRVEAAGMPLDRVSVLHQQPLERFMEIGHIADIQLDTFPVCGGTTTWHALWMGLSVVTLEAERGVDGCTAQLLRALGSGGEVAKDADEYVEATLQLMDDAERLQRQRLSARAGMQSSAWMDYPARTRELEKAYRIMWLNWLRGDKLNLSSSVDLDQLLAEMEIEA
ncbi:O-linked N-acetylglucosamine transferase, SPINDLY family protein [Delftia sp. DT-2]|uniref:O-linked N-acetylglucosamine transferase, SPINDLY family protein n=2 Tax=unclassified Delftia TaxID=2613839 RepID=UPI000646939D|nr:glycosyltransferase [Delftia sp. DT-2]MDC2862405.1 glycosyltransferase [Delftia sp. DT-2]